MVKSPCLVYVTYCCIVHSWRGRVCSSCGAFFHIIVRHRSSSEKRKRNNDGCVRVKMSKNHWKRSMTLPSNQLAIVTVLFGCICAISQGNYYYLHYEMYRFPQNYAIVGINDAPIPPFKQIIGKPNRAYKIWLYANIILLQYKTIIMIMIM